MSTKKNSSLFENINDDIIKVEVTSIGKYYVFGIYVSQDNDAEDIFIHKRSFQEEVILTIGDSIKGRVQIKTAGKHAGKPQLVSCEKIEKGLEDEKNC